MNVDLANYFSIYLKKRHKVVAIIKFIHIFGP